VLSITISFAIPKAASDYRQPITRALRLALPFRLSHTTVDRRAVVLSHISNTTTPCQRAPTLG